MLSYQTVIYQRQTAHVDEKIRLKLRFAVSNNLHAKRKKDAKCNLRFLYLHRSVVEPFRR